MAIDSAEKRLSISGIPIFLPGVTPNASQDQEWRQEAGWSYLGIAAAEPVQVVGSIALALPVRTFAKSVESRAFSRALVDRSTALTLEDDRDG